MSSIREQLKKAPKTKLSMREEGGLSLQDHPATDDYSDGSFKTVPVENIKTNPHQPRQIFEPEALKELSNSIKDKGVLQPVIIRVEGRENFILVAGERRLRAAKMAGLETIPCIVTKGNPAEIALIENLQREDLKPIEEAEALARMINEHEYTQEQLAQVIGKARTTITQTLSLNKLPDEIKKECPRADIPKRILIEIARNDDPKKMIALFNRVKSGEFKSDDVRQSVRKRTKSATRTPTAIALDRAFSLSNTLSKLDLNTSNESERVDLLAILNKIKTIIENKYLKES